MSNINKLQVRIISPYEIEHDSFADMVVMPGSDGDLGAMFGHVPMIVSLKLGNIAIYNGSDVQKFPIQSGIARITENKVDIMLA